MDTLDAETFWSAEEKEKEVTSTSETFDDKPPPTFRHVRRWVDRLGPNLRTFTRLAHSATGLALLCCDVGRNARHYGGHVARAQWNLS